MIQVTLDRVSKQFGQSHGVSEVDVSIQPGDFLLCLARVDAAKRPPCV